MKAKFPITSEAQYQTFRKYFPFACIDLGVYESLDKFRHDLSHGYIVSIRNGKIKIDDNASDFNFFKIIPKQIIPHQKKMIKDARRMIK